MMINDAKTCNFVANDSDSMLQGTNTMLSNLRSLTECLHSIENRVIGISNTMFFDDVKERQYTQPQDINTEIIHDKEVALAILDTLCRLASGIGINQ